MNSRDRFFATIQYQEVDRPASWLGLPDPKAVPQLLHHFGCNSVEELKQMIDDDIWPVEVPFNLAPAYHIAGAFNFKKKKDGGKNDERTLTAPGFFEDIDDPGEVDTFDWPDPSKYLDLEESARRAGSIPENKIRMGIMWSAHFQDACSAFGMETALVKMLTNPDMFKAVIDRIVDFYLKANKIFYEATKGQLDAVLIGNDFGSQNALMVNRDMLKDFVFEGTEKLVQQAKSYGLIVVHHSCGSIFPVIDDLAKTGVDCIHPIQALAKDMNIENLKNHFDKKIAFCGGVDAQNLLVNGTPDQISDNVHYLKEVFPTGLIVSPSHEAILTDIAPANIEALFKAVKS